MEEIWKDVKGYEGHYKISNLGKVETLKKDRKLLKFIKRSGYNYASLSMNGKRKNEAVHRLVAKHFIENPLNKEMVNHKDGNKQNNNVLNLEWVTVKENNQHAFNTGLMDSKKVKVIRSDGVKFESIVEASRFLGVHWSCVRDVLKGKQKTTKGYTFTYDKT